MPATPVGDRSRGDPEFGAAVQAGHPIGLSVTPPRAAGPRHPLDADRSAILTDLNGWLRERPSAPPCLSERLDELARSGAVLPELPADADFVGRFRPSAPPPASAPSASAPHGGGRG